MNPVLENIMTRRSTRSFSEKPVPDDILKDILTAGLYAPSAMNTQPWIFTVVRDAEKLESLREAIANAMYQPDYHRFYNAPLFIIVTVPEDYRHGPMDTACALENMFLVAHSEGVGSVWINQLRDCCAEPSVRAVLSSFGIPENHVCYGCGAFGYSSDQGNRTNKGIVNIVP